METLVNFILDNKDVITILVVIGTLIISSLSLYFTFKNNKTVHYINAITKSRIEWIQNLRETVADFISQTNIYLNVYYDDFDKSGEHLSKCKQLASKIALLLNCCDEKDKEIVDIVNQILVTYYNYYDSARDCEVKDGFFKETKSMTSNKELTEQKINELTIKVQLYLKTEWNRVKYESSGMKYERETVEFDYLELKEKIKCPDYHNRKWKRFWINIRSKAVRIIATPKVIIMLLIAAVAIIACFKYINLILISVTT